MPTLDTPVNALPKVRPAEAAALRRLGITTVADLLQHLPFAWESYGEPVLVRELAPGGQATVVGRLSGVRAIRSPRKRRVLTEATLTDDAGGRLRIAWFNQPWVARELHDGDRVALAGTVKVGRYGYEMSSPLREKIGAGGPSQVGGEMAKYHLTAGITSKKIRELVEPLLPLADGIPELIPDELRLARGLPGVADAVRWGHRPQSAAEWGKAVERAQVAELLVLQVTFVLAARLLAAEPALPVPYRQEVIDAFKAGLAFQLTGAQRRATWDIYRDLELEVPMNRLLNGDVGSGKTVVAAAAVAMTHAAGLQSVVMAPTEILARQHLHKFRSYLEESIPGLTVELLVSGLPAAERRRVVTAVASGHTGLLVGTHALIEEEVEIANLGLAVVDEQHRFGTRQREKLRSKGRGRPHFLAMTATPIPRSLALAIYGEMKLSTLDEVPPGRTPVATRVVPPGDRGSAEELVRREVGLGRQVFIICPLIEESEKLEVKAATVEFDRLRTAVFPELRLALVHGRLKDKDRVMRGFAAGEYDILVATAVVEVGVDIPNASVMVIEGADRFGLAQLHQFRGRVGRGAAASHCLLLADDPSEKSLQRLELLAREHDGFKLAQEDMRLRGMGELIGARQHGVSDLAMQGLQKPMLLNEIRDAAETLVAADPELTTHPLLKKAVGVRLELTSIS